MELSAKGNNERFIAACERQPRRTKKDSGRVGGRVWLQQLARFHSVKDPAVWNFDEDNVIAFLRSKVKVGVPVWKRLMIVKGLIVYRNKVLRSQHPRLEHLRAALQARAANERSQHDGVDIEEAIGRIDPNELDVIQELRRTLRRHGKSYNTEKRT